MNNLLFMLKAATSVKKFLLLNKILTGKHAHIDMIDIYFEKIHTQKLGTDKEMKK